MSQSIAPVLTDQQVDDSPTLTFEEYRVYQGEPDVQYELYKGKLIPMPTATVLHIKICEYLVYKLQRYLAAHNLDLVVKTGLGVRTDEDKSRIPDVVVCTQSLLEQAAARPGGGILDFDEKPLLVIEVVSENRRADYVIKRGEYELANVPEYCIVDPKSGKQKIRLLALIDGEESYTQTDFLPGEELISVVFPDFVLSVDEILNPPFVEELVKAERAQLQESQQQAVMERQRADEERQRADEERQRADEERQRADEERQRADEERQRAERLAARLRELDIDPDTVV
ncbi:MAG: Uma2 family endonuclease [Microcoleus anatoxicus]|uniref:Uma2 family endonuclease n=1 Tax=Microcoleus anatoxicus TaxID=2705319 RepID=UPI003670E9BB